MTIYKKQAIKYMKDNKINGTIISANTNGFAYMLYNGESYFVSWYNVD